MTSYVDILLRGTKKRGPLGSALVFTKMESPAYAFASTAFPSFSATIS
jgi:hypothetical protein